jgi:hypothetical protein
MTPLISFPPVDPDLVGDQYLNGYVLMYVLDTGARHYCHRCCQSE